MLRQLVASLTAAAHNGLNKGLAALVQTLVALGLGVTGIGLLLVATVMGLSRLMGPLLAFGLTGFVLLLLALVIASRRRTQPHAAPQPPTPTPLLEPDQIAFALGFFLARSILARRR